MRVSSGINILVDELNWFYSKGNSSETVLDLPVNMDPLHDGNSGFFKEDFHKWLYVVSKRILRWSRVQLHFISTILKHFVLYGLK